MSSRLRSALTLALCLTALPLALAHAGAPQYGTDTNPGDIVCALDGGNAAGTGNDHYNKTDKSKTFLCAKNQGNNPSIDGNYRDSTNASRSPNDLGTSYAGAVRLNAGTMALTPIDVYSVCRYLDNGSGDSYFVPFKVNQTGAANLLTVAWGDGRSEWGDFLNSAQAGGVASLSVWRCAREYKSDVNSDPDKTGGLLYGPTTAMSSTIYAPDTISGDNGPQILSDGGYMGEIFPYSRFPGPEAKYIRTISHTCQKKVAGDAELCKTEYSPCPEPDDLLKTCPSYYYHHRCKFADSSWSETWHMTASPLDSDWHSQPLNDPSWQKVEVCRDSAVSSYRDTECYVEKEEVVDSDGCTQCVDAGGGRNNQNYYTNNYANTWKAGGASADPKACQPQPPGEGPCNLPPACLFNAAAVALGLTNMAPDVNNMAALTMLFNVQIQKALDNGECDTAISLLSQLNQGVKWANAFAAQYWMQKGKCEEFGSYCETETCHETTFGTWPGFN